MWGYMDHICYVYRQVRGQLRDAVRVARCSENYCFNCGFLPGILFDLCLSVVTLLQVMFFFF